MCVTDAQQGVSEAVLVTRFGLEKHHLENCVRYRFTARSQ